MVDRLRQNPMGQVQLEYGTDRSFSLQIIAARRDLGVDITGLGQALRALLDMVAPWDPCSSRTRHFDVQMLSTSNPINSIQRSGKCISYGRAPAWSHGELRRDAAETGSRA
jgi:HAE1 family hydrophobic/amphiphilic exporter-1